MRQSGRMGKKGNDQISVLSLAVPVSAIDFWKRRLIDHGFNVKESQRFGERILQFQHPCGIDYELAGDDADDREPYSGGEVPAELAIRGTHGITVRTRELDSASEFMGQGWNLKQQATDGSYTRWVFGDGGTAKIIDVLHEPNLPNGTWTFGEGTIHHCAFQVDDLGVHVAGGVSALPTW